MERLTFDGNFCDIALCSEVRYGSFCEDGSCSQRRVWERLKQYEDTGLEPEEVEQIKRAAVYMMFEDVAHFVRYTLSNFDELQKYKALGDYNRLRELKQADDEGRCVVLPCMIGDTVYVLNHHLGRVFENEVAGFSVGYQSDNRNSVSTVYVGKYGSKTFRRWKFQRFGKTVFLTREEAEAALREEIADER